MNNIKNNNGISLIDKEWEVKNYLESAIFEEGCGAQEPYGEESIIMYQRLTKELALKGQKALLDLGYYVNIVCEKTASLNANYYPNQSGTLDSNQYCLIYASNANEMKEATEHILENGNFFVAFELQNSGFDHNQTLKFYDKDNELKCVCYTSSGQFHNAEQIGREILNENPNLSYAVANLENDIVPITRIGEENKKVGINGMIYYDELFNAIGNDNLKSLKKCVEKGVDVNTKDFWDNTPLILASQNGHFEIAKYLIENGADINAKNNSGWTALGLANSFNHKEIAEYLIQHGAKTNEELENNNEETQTIRKRR